jgi:hypothetical protein
MAIYGGDANWGLGFIASLPSRGRIASDTGEQILKKRPMGRGPTARRQHHHRRPQRQQLGRAGARTPQHGGVSAVNATIALAGRRNVVIDAVSKLIAAGRHRHACTADIAAAKASQRVA